MPVNETKNTADESVAAPAANAKLEHSQGGVTTRDDALDLGVPMLPGDPSEPTGPEDAAGGPTRGDYSQRIGDSYYNPHTTVAVKDAEPGEPNVRVVAQRPIFSERGEDAGKKGGVDVLSDAYTVKTARHK